MPMISRTELDLTEMHFVLHKIKHLKHEKITSDTHKSELYSWAYNSWTLGLIS